MFFREFFTALYKDWIASVSGLASVVLAVWAAIILPQSTVLRRSLWIAFAVCLFIASYRIWVAAYKKSREEEAKNLRPGITGSIKDITLKEMYDQTKVGLAAAKLRHGQPPSAVLQPMTMAQLDSRGMTAEDIVGVHVYLKAHFVANRQETTVSNFRLEIESTSGSFEATHPEEDEIFQMYWNDALPRDDAKRFTNLVGFINSGEVAEIGHHVQGHLHFMVPELMPKDFDEGKVQFTLVVVDAWEGGHRLTLERSKYSLPKPSERITTFAPIEYW